MEFIRHSGHCYKPCWDFPSDDMSNDNILQVQSCKKLILSSLQWFRIFVKVEHIHKFDRWSVPHQKFISFWQLFITFFAKELKHSGLFHDTGNKCSILTTESAVATFHVLRILSSRNYSTFYATRLNLNRPVIQTSFPLIISEQRH